MSDILVVVSKVKDVVRAEGGDTMRTGQDFIEEISRLVESVTKTAVQRAKKAGRATVRDEDI